MNHELSSLRTQLREASQQMLTLLDTFLGREPLLPGSLYTLRRKCGKPNCRCTRGELHESTVLAYRGQGRSQNVSPAPKQLEPLRKLTEPYRRFRQARTQLARLQRQLLTRVDAIEAARVQQGEATFRKLRDPNAHVRSTPSRR